MDQKKSVIFIVEDEKDIRDALSEVLQERSYETISAANGWEALRLLETGPLPDLIILDLMMPVMDGLAFIDEKKKNSQWDAVPVVVITAAGPYEGRIPLKGAASVLRKPVDINELLQVVSSHV